jgi:hypothetical protein
LDSFLDYYIVLIYVGHFFVDCNWGDHVGDVAQAFGVIGQKTPSGLQWSEFQQAMAKYKQVQLESTERVLSMIR